jgi:translation initiation factor 3 subunit C
VVRTEKEKRYESLYNIIKNIRNSKKIRDFNKMLTNYEDLLKAYDKASGVIKKEEKGVVPRFYIKILVEMEDLVNETWEDTAGRKAMSKVNGKSLGGLRQKLRKYIRENMEAEVTKFRENPDGGEEEEEEEEKEEEQAEQEEEDSSQGKRAPSVPKERKIREKSTAGDDSDFSDDEWPSDSDSSSSSDDEKPTGGYTREMFLKKAVDPEKERKKEEKKTEKILKKQADTEKRA